MNGLFFRKTSLSLSIVRTSKNILEGVAYEKTTTTAERKSLYRESTESKENPFKKSSEMDLVFGFISLFFRGLGIFSIHENEGSSVVFER
ncbi:hypothetical protein ACJK21_03715 [Enterococcus faecium]|uniref:hypothetical protein n=1 Tax=Enterococcus faecium TaxID=1352 RepID=UPI0002FBC19D|nr:hypothetical protein [Enterococcus faecium]